MYVHMYILASISILHLVYGLEEETEVMYGKKKHHGTVKTRQLIGITNF